MMQGHCGQMDMPGSNNCCKKAPKGVSDSALKTDTVTLHPVTFAIAWMSSFDLLAPENASRVWIQRPEHSPPEPPPSAITILRI